MRRYALAGTGIRGLCFAQAIEGEFRDHASLVGLFDHNLKRAAGFCQELGRQVPAFDDFTRMVQECAPDAVLICTPDHTHADMVHEAYRHGLKAIVEKPLATTVADVRRIVDLEQRYERRAQVTFNMRYATYSVRLKQVLAEHDIGKIRQITLDWFMDKVHGPEYFRRWHRYLAKSGGLFVHKSSHHFDLVNWLIDDRPESVQATGSLQVFGRNGAFRGSNCRSCDHVTICPFYSDISKWDEPSRVKMQRLYFAAEAGDGYIRDSCVFTQDIDSYDTMSALVTYRGGAQLAYSLNAYAPYEGYRLTFTGEKGRIEAEEHFGGLMLNKVEDSAAIRLIRGDNRQDIRIETLDVPVDRREHGGGDTNLYRHIFVPDVPDPLGQHAGVLAGADSCLVGILANESVRTGRRQTIPDLALQPTTH